MEWYCCLHALSIGTFGTLKDFEEYLVPRKPHFHLSCVRMFNNLGMSNGTAEDGKIGYRRIVQALRGWYGRCQEMVLLVYTLYPFP